MSYRCDLCYINDFTSQGQLVRKYGCFDTKQHYIRHLRTSKHTKNLNRCANLDDAFECPACGIKLDSEGWKNHKRNNYLLISEANCDLSEETECKATREWIRQNRKFVEDLEELISNQKISCNNYEIPRKGRHSNCYEFWDAYVCFKQGKRSKKG